MDMIDNRFWREWIHKRSNTIKINIAFLLNGYLCIQFVWRTYKELFVIECNKIKCYIVAVEIGAGISWLNEFLANCRMFAQSIPSNYITHFIRHIERIDEKDCNWRMWIGTDYDGLLGIFLFSWAQLQKTNPVLLI